METANEAHANEFKDHFRDLYPSARFTVLELDEKYKMSNIIPHNT